MSSCEQYALLVLEQLWTGKDLRPGITSVLPFMEGLSKFHGFQIYYANFYDNSSFGSALKIFSKAKNKKQILYVASHGNKGNGDCRAGLASASLQQVATLVQANGDKIVGVLLGACEVGSSRSTLLRMLSKHEFKDKLAANWLFAYKHRVDWMGGTIVDVRVLDVIFGHIAECERKGISAFNFDTVIDEFMLALSCFDSQWLIADEDIGATNPVDRNIRDTVALFTRGNGSNAKDVTSELISRLNW